MRHWRCVVAPSFGGGSIPVPSVAKPSAPSISAATAAAWGKKRDRFDQVGLAGAVRPNQRDRSGTGGERGALVVAEIMQIEATDECGHRFGIRSQAASIPDDRLPIPVKRASASGHRARRAALCPGSVLVILDRQALARRLCFWFSPRYREDSVN